jgi:hypothetical protein
VKIKIATISDMYMQYVINMPIGIESTYAVTLQYSGNILLFIGRAARCK